MTSKNPPRFDLKALKASAGETVFGRGEGYFRRGAVKILGIEPTRVTARVTGSEVYRTVVAGEGHSIGGECSCPAFSREGFCKHMIAVALAANAALEAGELQVDDPFARIRDYLRTRSVDDLADMIVEIADRDDRLMRKLSVAAAVQGGDSQAVAVQLRSAIRDATRTNGYVDYGRAPRWAAGVDAALDTLADLASGPHAAAALALAEYAASRIARAIQNIDNSDGHAGVLLARTRRIHLDACRAVRPDPVGLARKLFVHEMREDVDIFHGSVADYEDVLGEAGLAEYRRLAEQAWETLKAERGSRSGARVGEFDEFRLRWILDYFAEREGDIELRIALRSKHLSSPWGYLQLAQFCLDHGREEEALRRAEDALWLFEDQTPDEQLVCFAAGLLAKAGRKAEAEAHVWRAFEKVPSPGLYRRCRDLTGKPAVERAIACLHRHIAAGTWKRLVPPTDLLVRIMIEEKMFDAAWAVVREHGAPITTRDALAEASETTHAAEALAAYAVRVEELVKTGGNTAYAEAARLVARMGRLRSLAEQTAYLADLKERHARRRNFMKTLELRPQAASRDRAARGG